MTPLFGRPRCLVIAFFLLAAVPTDRLRASEAEPRMVDRLIQQMGGGSFAEREAAVKALLVLGEPALPALHRSCRAGSDAELDSCAARLIESIEAQATRRVRAALEALGARIDGDPFRPGSLLGSMGSIDLSDTAATDADLALLSRLDHLHSLNLARTKVTDAGLAHLARCDLEHLNLSETGVTDAGMELLKGRWSLVDLDLSGTRVGDKGLGWVEKFEQIMALESQRSLALNLSRTRVTDAGLEHLKKVRLRSLDLSHTALTGAGLAHLRQPDWAPGWGIAQAKINGLERWRAGLRILSLAGTKVGDRELDHLTRLDGLEELDLSDTRTTDEGLSVIGWLTRLRLLRLAGDKVGDDGIATLASRGWWRADELYTLDLAKTRVTDAGLKHLQGSRVLDLNLSGTAVTDSGVADLRKARPRLEIKR